MRVRLCVCFDDTNAGYEVSVFEGPHTAQSWLATEASGPTSLVRTEHWFALARAHCLKRRAKSSETGAVLEGLEHGVGLERFADRGGQGAGAMQLRAAVGLWRRKFGVVEKRAIEFTTSLTFWVMPRPTAMSALLALLLLSSCGAGPAPSMGADGALAGDPDGAAELAIPQLRYEPADGDDWTNTLVLSFELGVTVDEANRVLGSLDAEIVGGVTGVEGRAAGLLVVRMPTQTVEEMAEVLAAMEADPAVAFAAADLPLVPAAATASPSTGVPSGWTWTDPPSGPNRHLEMSGVPQMWNFGDAARKQGPPSVVTVVDVGFAPHPEFAPEWAGNIDPHGTAVAGVIGAPWNDGVGIDGVSPHVRLVPANVASMAVFATAVPELFAQGASVINVSLAYGADVPLLVPEGPRASFINAGALVIEAMRAFEQAGGSLPVIVSAAGNAEFDIPVDCAFESPLNTAALELGAANIIVVEGVLHSPQTDGGAVAYPLSHYGAPLSAPARVTTLDLAGGYAEMTGTSFSAPMVAGTVAFMYAIAPDLRAPTLTENPALAALLATARAVPDAPGAVEGLSPRAVAPRLDAFAAALDLDRLLGGTHVLEQLCDIDDGTPDGNTRVDPRSGAVVTDMDADGDGGLGDGVVDMRDFRRFRDWLLESEGRGALDGGPEHIKRDLNLDGRVQSTAEEVYPRADFNGDGRIDRTAQRRVPGALGREATDLDVFATVFSDPEVDADQLLELLDSGDIHVDLARCFDRLDAARIEVTIDGQRRTQVVDGSGAPLLFTVVMGDQTALVEAFDGSGTLLADPETTVTLEDAGQDVFLQPDCGPSGYLATRIDAALPQEMNDRGQVLAGGGPYVIVDPDGSVTPVDPGQPRENQLHYLTENGAFAIPTIGPLVVGPDAYPTPTWKTISRNGVIAGHYDVLGRTRQAFVYAGGPAGGPPARMLGTFVDAGGGFEIAPDGQDFGTSNRHGVNDVGTVVGSAREPGEQASHAAILSGAQPQYLDRPADATNSRATMINNEGVIAGYFDATPTRWTETGYQEIAPDPTFTSLRLLGDDGTLIADCSGTGCYLALYPDADAFEPLPREVSVDEDDGSETFYRVAYLHDMNADGVLLVSATPPGDSSPTAPRTTLLLTPR